MSRITWVIIYIALISGAFYSITKVRVYFTQMYFVKDGSEIKSFFEIEEKYFRAGGQVITTYVES